MNGFQIYAVAYFAVGLITAITVLAVRRTAYRRAHLSWPRRDQAWYFILTIVVWWVALGMSITNDCGRIDRDWIDHMEVTPNEDGYWLVTRGGRAHAFGQAWKYRREGQRRSHPADPTDCQLVVTSRFGRVMVSEKCTHHGDRFNQPLTAPIVDALATGHGRGYWLVGADGGVFAYGNAGFFGSLGVKSQDYGLNWANLKLPDQLAVRYLPLRPEATKSGDGNFKTDPARAAEAGVKGGGSDEPVAVPI